MIEDLKARLKEYREDLFELRKFHQCASVDPTYDCSKQIQQLEDAILGCLVRMMPERKCILNNPNKRVYAKANYWIGNCKSIDIEHWGNTPEEALSKALEIDG